MHVSYVPTYCLELSHKNRERETRSQRQTYEQDYSIVVYCKPEL